MLYEEFAQEELSYKVSETEEILEAILDRYDAAETSYTQPFSDTIC